jgi:two-component system, sensor histidine kinase and response regulator
MFITKVIGKGHGIRVGLYHRSGSAMHYYLYQSKVIKDAFRRIRLALPQGSALPDEAWQKRHRGILVLLWLHVLGIPCFGFTHGNPLVQNIAAGTIVMGITALAMWKTLGRRTQSGVATLGLMTSSALLVHLSGGYIELHFHFFVMMAVVALYQDWAPFLLALLFIVVDHGVMGMVASHAVYNHGQGQENPWTWAMVHGVFILAESAALLVFWRLNESAQAQAIESKAAGLVIETALDAVISTDVHGKIIDWNRQAEVLFQYTRDEAIGKDFCKTVISSAYQEGHAHSIRQFLEAVDCRVFERRIETVAVRRDGSTFSAEMAISPLQVSGSYIFNSFIEDITDRKRNEGQLKHAKELAELANRSKSEFLANMSHEIRTPMNGVLGMTELLLATSLTDRQRRYANNVRLSGEGLLTTINDILDFSKIEAGKLSLERVDFDLRDAVEEVIELLAERAHSKNLELVCNIPTEVPTAVQGDPYRLRQVLMNLIGNAIKFTEHGEVVVDVSTLEQARTTVVLQIGVKDTGVGIPHGAQLHIFDAFSQADGTTTRKFGGTGLGLSIAKQLVELMNGTIKVESTPNEGSTFSFTARFPKQVKSAEALRSTLPQSVQGLRVLIADDNATNLSILKHQMLGWGMQPDVVQNGRQALERLRAAAFEANFYDIAILDMKMPDMDGLELAQAIKAEPKIAPRRIAILSSIAMDGATDAARAAGVSMFLRKPLRQRELYRALTTMMNEQEESASEVAGLTELRRPTVQFEGHVLLVEDNPVNQELAQNILEVFGCRVDVAANGREYLAAVDRSSYDLVLMDCQMPEMDGFEATAEIRQREAHEDNRRRLAVVALTAHALQGDREHCLGAGMDDYLSKPFTQDQLVMILERWLTRKVGTDPNHRTVASPVASTIGTKFTPEDTDDSSLPVMDRQTLTAIRALQRPGKPDVLNKAINIYLDTAPKLLRALRIALEARDAIGIHTAAHSLKSSSASLGALELAHWCKELETMGRMQALNEAGPILRKLENGYTTVQSMLQAEVR